MLHRVVPVGVHESVKRLNLRSISRNLRFLRQLQDAMRSYCDSGDLGALINAFPVAEAAARVAAAAGSGFAGGRSV